MHFFPRNIQSLRWSHEILSYTFGNHLVLQTEVIGRDLQNETNKTLTVVLAAERWHFEPGENKASVNLWFGSDERGPESDF